MYMEGENKRYNRIINLVRAFEKDGYDAKKIITKFNKIGIMAEHKTAVNYDTGEKKKAYYVEGSSYEMGYLMGLLAEKEISLMTTEFIRKVIPQFINDGVSRRGRIVEEFLISLVSGLSKDVFLDLPEEIRDEMRGIYDGCKKHNPYTKVNMNRLFILNAGIDILCSYVYTGIFFDKRFAQYKPSDFRIPFFCNAFSVFGSVAAGGHYFGRDFMFPTAGVFQNTAAFVVYNPDDTSRGRAYPFVSITAPGMVGSISAMNIFGVGIGVDMSPAANCNPAKIGINSILLTRMAAEFSGSARQAVEIIKTSRRGVSWIYIIADGSSNNACIVEAGDSNSNPDFLSFPPETIKYLLPDKSFIDSHKTAEFQDGIMVRWSDYSYPSDYLEYNNKLWEYYNKKHSGQRVIYKDAFTKTGYINRSFEEKNCPSIFYFAPQRESSNNIVIAANHFIIPEMRLYAMYPWTAAIVGDRINDMQWRYDELNNQILNIIDKKGFIHYQDAKQLIDFLAPYGKYPLYYADNSRSSDGREIRIEGCTSVFDLKNKTVENHYGYYCDEWVKLTLRNYLV